MTEYLQHGRFVAILYKKSATAIKKARKKRAPSIGRSSKTGQVFRKPTSGADAGRFRRAIAIRRSERAVQAPQTVTPAPRGSNPVRAPKSNEFKRRVLRMAGSQACGFLGQDLFLLIKKPPMRIGGRTSEKSLESLMRPKRSRTSKGVRRRALRGGTLFAAENLIFWLFTESWGEQGAAERRKQHGRKDCTAKRAYFPLCPFLHSEGM